MGTNTMPNSRQEYTLQTNYFTDEQIFDWEYREALKKQPDTGDADLAKYNEYKFLKERYIFEVTNLFQALLAQDKKPNLSINKIEDYVNGKIPIEIVPQKQGGDGASQTLKWITVKWASHQTFARIFCVENQKSWDNEKYTIVKRTKKGFFQFRCNKCSHAWTTHYGTLKFYICFKKDPSGFYREDEIIVRIIAYKLDCKNCMHWADSGKFGFSANKLEADHIATRYID